MTNKQKLPSRRAKSWPVLMERIDGLYREAFTLPSWKVTRCSVTKDGGYILRIEPADRSLVEPVKESRTVSEAEQWRPLVAGIRDNLMTAAYTHADESAPWGEWDDILRFQDWAEGLGNKASELFAILLNNQSALQATTTPCEHKNTGVSQLLNWCTDCGAIRQAVGTEWEGWQLPKNTQATMARAEAAEVALDAARADAARADAWFSPDNWVCECGHKRKEHDPSRQLYNGRISKNVVMCGHVYSWETDYDGKRIPNGSCSCCEFIPRKSRGESKQLKVAEKTIVVLEAALDEAKKALRAMIADYQFSAGKRSLEQVYAKTHAVWKGVEALAHIEQMQEGQP